MTNDNIILVNSNNSYWKCYFNLPKQFLPILGNIESAQSTRDNFSWNIANRALVFGSLAFVPSARDCSAFWISFTGQVRVFKGLRVLNSTSLCSCPADCPVENFSAALRLWGTRKGNVLLFTWRATCTPCLVRKSFENLVSKLSEYYPRVIVIDLRQAFLHETIN